jgi:hypothetical protein
VNDVRLKAFREKFSVLDGLPIDEIPSHRIALSLVHPLERIDVAISAIRWIEPRPCRIFTCGTKSISTGPFVEICLASYIRERIYRLTKRIVGESMEVLVGGESVIKPIVREPVGIHQSLAFPEFSYEDAVVLAGRLRARWRDVRPRPVS